MAGDDGGSAAPIVARLRRAAGPSGRLRFDRFLEIALYDSELGFYTSGAPRLGVGGDFYTAAHVHPLFGQSVGERVLAEFERLGRPERFRVLEMGPGDGRLAADVAATVSAGLAHREEIDYVLVERSRPLRERAAARLRADGVPRVRWLLSESLASDGPFVGIVLANEFLDALPVRRLVWRAGAWRELLVEVGALPFRWVESDAPARFPSGPLMDGPREGAVTEVGPSAEAFVREVGDHLQAGAALLLDYGADEPELVTGHPSGTLVGLRAHRVVADPLASPGEVDLSAFVNFGRLRAAARTSGLREVAFRSQAEALEAWGLSRLAERARAAISDPEGQVRLQLALKNLRFGFGTFRVLELAPLAG